MNYDIRINFSTEDIELGDLMYDSINDVMVEVVYINNLDTMPMKQLVLRDTNNGIVFIEALLGKGTELPILKDGKPRYKHLMKTQEPYIINWPTAPQPIWPSQPLCPDYPLWTWPYEYNYCEDLGPIENIPQDQNFPFSDTTQGHCDLTGTSGENDISNTVYNAKDNITYTFIWDWM